MAVAPKTNYSDKPNYLPPSSLPLPSLPPRLIKSGQVATKFSILQSEAGQMSRGP